jgi:hypothetical protein
MLEVHGERRREDQTDSKPACCSILDFSTTLRCYYCASVGRSGWYAGTSGTTTPWDADDWPDWPPRPREALRLRGCSHLSDLQAPLPPNSGIVRDLSPGFRFPPLLRLGLTVQPQEVQASFWQTSISIFLPPILTARHNSLPKSGPQAKDCTHLLISTSAVCPSQRGLDLKGPTPIQEHILRRLGNLQDLLHPRIHASSIIHARRSRSAWVWRGNTGGTCVQHSLLPSVLRLI